MAPASPDTDERGPAMTGMHVEDLLILLSLIPLFILGVFFRTTWWGKVGLGVVFVVMAVVLVTRLRRTHRAFTGRDQDL